MAKRLRVLLTNTQHNPTRAEIVAYDRPVGERFFDGIPMEWAGWGIREGSMKLSAQWLVNFDHLSDMTYRVEHSEFSGYTVGIFIVDDEEAEEAQVV